MPNKSITKVWSFKSSSSDKTYQTLQYNDGSTSCDCPGWTRRCPAGVRSCRHTRSVQLGTADDEAIDFIEYDEQKPVKKMLHTGEIVSTKTKKPTTPVLTYGNRKLCI